MTLFLNNEEVKSLLSMNDYLEAIEEGLRELEHGRVVMVPRTDASVLTLDDPNITYRFKTIQGGIQKFRIFAIRINSNLMSFPEVNGKRRLVKLPRACNQFVGFVILFSMDTGEPLVFFQDGYFQKMRVAAMSGIGAKYLARKEATSIGIIGSGWQAGAKLMALCAVRPITHIKVYSPNPNHRRSFAEEMSKSLGVDVDVVDTPEAAVKGTDIACSATNQHVPVFKGIWLEEGMHAVCVQRYELDDETYKRPDIVVSNARPWGRYWGKEKDSDYDPYYKQDWVMGDRTEIDYIAKTRREGFIDWQKTPGLAEVVVGKVRRSNDRQISLHVNHIGLGFQFAAAGAKLYQVAREKRVGREIPTEWLLQTEHD